MINLRFWLPAIVLIAGCSSTKNVTNNIETTPSEKVETSVEVVESAPENWHHLSFSNPNFVGIGTDSAYSTILKNKSPKKEIVVAIIDSGTDIEHEDLASNIWVNANEIPNNNIDDDENGYVDDVHGWNFIGGKNGDNVDKDTYELTRVYVNLRDKFENVDPTILQGTEKEEYERYLQIKTEFEAEKLNAKRNFENLSQIKQSIDGAKRIFEVSTIDSVSNEDLRSKSNDSPFMQQAKSIIKYFRDLGVTESDITEAYNQFDKMYNYAYNEDFDPRHIVGDDYEDLSNRFYGNNDVKGPRSDHGTHVAGIVGAVRNNSIGMDGVANNVKLMIVRAVPDGDERDKDIANAIRYAVENGANIINMSFGKAYSPQKFYVDEALKFADENNVLLVNAAGNSGENIDSTLSFPNKFYEDGGMMNNFITVGASSWMGDSLTAAQFSNYGKSVDLFAPGVDVYSTTPENTYKANSGTSMASPVVAGVAALVWSYNPNLTAAELKDVLLKSATPLVDLPVYKPGSDEAVTFGELSNTGRIINVYQALKLADSINN